MRLFTGIQIPDDIQERLRVLIEHLRPTADVNWSRIPNLHITTKFVGDWSCSRLEELTAALRGVNRTRAIDIEIKSLGWFPNSHKPRVFWAGIDAGQELDALAEATESSLARIGVARESRPFSPHLTLARIGEPAGLAALRQAVARLESTGFGKFTAQQFHLYSSEPAAGGTVYAILRDFPLVHA